MARYTNPITVLALGLLALALPALAEQCGSAVYDPAIYVCHDNQFLCPVVNGEGYSYCNGACYSRFMYQCTSPGAVLAELPRLGDGTRYRLTAWNPTQGVHGQPIQACGRFWRVGGEACSYCPVEVVGAACPPGNRTGMVAPGGMNTLVPGGQQFYLDPYWSVGYTQAHSASIPTGSTVGGLVAYRGGGLVNANAPGTTWLACPPTASGGGGGRWTLRSENATTAPNRGSCVGINLAVEVIGDSADAWQYT